jgi:farnesyl diphosphate synthase
LPEPFANRLSAFTDRVEAHLDRTLPTTGQTPRSLHGAMRYAVLNGGKRVRPLLVYAAGECLGVDPEALDAPAVAIELIHAFSLVHDDLPAMDDDDLRRGMPTVHRKFDEATAILAGDALLPLAFAILGESPAMSGKQIVRLVCLIANASGSLGMTGGQSIDLASEGKQLSGPELEQMHSLKTGALIHACVMSACCLCDSLTAGQEDAMDVFGRSIGLAFQIRDDLLDVEGDTDTIGKTAGADIRHAKATWPAIFGVAESRRRCDELLDTAHSALDRFGERAESLRWLANYIVQRSQ